MEVLHNADNDAAQESNNAPDPGTGANLGGWEGFGQDSLGAGAAIASTSTGRGGSAFPALIDRPEPFAPEWPSTASFRTYSNG